GEFSNRVLERPRKKKTRRTNSLDASYGIGHKRNMTNTSNEFPVLSASLVALAHPDLEDSQLGDAIADAWWRVQRGTDEPIACVLAVMMHGSEHTGRYGSWPVIAVPRTGGYAPARPLTYSCIADAMLEWDPFESR